MNTKVVLFLCVCAIALCSSAKLRSDNIFPPYIHACKRNDDAFGCVLDNVEKCRPYLAKGIPRLQVPALEPLSLPQLDIIGNNLRISLTNLKVFNLPALKITGGYLRFDNFAMHVQLTIPYVYHEFDYEAKGKVLILNINGNGSGYVNTSDVNLDIATKGHPVTKNGKEHLVIDSVNVQYKSGTGEFHVENLFKERKELTDETNRLVNDNFHEFESEISPDIAKSITSVFRAIATDITEKFSYDELFPKN